MSKVFIYLYPIKDFASMFAPFVFTEDSKMTDYDKITRDEPFNVLNDTIDKRYRKKGYKIVFVTYRDKNIYGIKVQPEDSVIKTDITFKEVQTNYVYPDEKEIIKQIGFADELVIGGYHALDCVRRVGETALESGINTLVDLDLTDLFFYLYKQNGYFDKETYDPYKFKSYIINRSGRNNRELMEKIFNRNYESAVYGYNIDNKIKIKSK